MNEIKDMEFQKFIVLKVEDLEESITDIEVTTFLKILENYNKYRESKGKEAYPKYYVVNADEKYAPAIKAVIENEGIPKPKVWVNEDSI